MTAPITWAEATSPILWSNIGIDWNTPAIADSSTFALSNTFPSSGVGTLVAFSTIGANMGKIHASTLATSGVISFGNNMGYPSEGGFTFTGDATMYQMYLRHGRMWSILIEYKTNFGSPGRLKDERRPKDESWPC